MHPTIKQLFKAVALLVGATVIVGTLIFFNLNSTFIYNELVQLDLIPKPEKLTELYFNDHTNLPTSTTSKRAVDFAFVIHNLETTDYQYVYRVSVKTHGTRYVVDVGNVLLKNNHYYVKNEILNLINSSERQEVIVELINKQQSIHFWIGE